jgi:dUTP pyrophosphatase
MKIKLDPGAVMPSRAHETDAGLDLKARDPIWIHPGEHVILDTGVHVAVPTGYVGLITSKSGLMAKGITCRGTIDSGYTGSIRAVLYNHGPEGYLVNAGDKVCQLVLVPIITPELEVVDELDETERSDGGFGSTGR